jgi:hypothetical protein
METSKRNDSDGARGGVFPLTVSFFAKESKGNVIGFLNSARFAGTALGPMLAATLLAFSNFPTPYLFISLITLLALLKFVSIFRNQAVEIHVP